MPARCRATWGVGFVLHTGMSIARQTLTSCSGPQKEGRKQPHPNPAPSRPRGPSDLGGHGAFGCPRHTDLDVVLMPALALPP